jgi:hypothetical protein
LNNLTLGQASQLDPDFATFIKRKAIKTYEEFIDMLYIDLDSIVEDMMRHRTMHPVSKSEDQLTEHILAQLRCHTYSAERDSDMGGHGDMCVQKNKFLWIGEAKKHSDYQYLGDGFHQLCTRYSCPTNSSNHGGLIIYIHIEKGKLIVDEWVKRLKTRKLIGFENYEPINISKCTRNTDYYSSVHEHAGTSYPYHVRHIPIFLHHNPMDKSGRSRKK